MKKTLTVLVGLASLTLCAQTAPPELDSATANQVRMIIQQDNTIQTQINTLLAQKYVNVTTLRNLEKDIERRYPGYKLNEQSGKLIAK